ncbi:hypothetical protein ANN_15112 [Periplaneta americana]|uniref:Uncharacterized protein n=1 Tax=Periplaneta americana TaxID=6978 RepID=A0ABQ8T0E8_PERAM|nr:hypothetical protein ANN_15112 [Periplaneta americana]
MEATNPDSGQKWRATRRVGIRDSPQLPGLARQHINWKRTNVIRFLDLESGNVYIAEIHGVRLFVRCECGVLCCRHLADPSQGTEAYRLERIDCEITKSYPRSGDWAEILVIILVINSGFWTCHISGKGLGNEGQNLAFPEACIGPLCTLYAMLLEVRLMAIVNQHWQLLLPVVLYGCETWTLTLREEQRLRVFENKVLRKIFGAKRDEVTGEWRKLHNAELHALYSSPDIIRNIKSRRLRWAGHVARMGESRNAYRVLVGRPEGKRPLGRPRRRWEDSIKMDLREVGYDGRDWINLAQDRDQWPAYVRAAMNLRVP